MPIAEREAEVVWEGSLARGSGSLTSGSRVLDGSLVTWAARTQRRRTEGRAPRSSSPLPTQAASRWRSRSFWEGGRDA